jgi:NAD+ kinase
VSNVLIVAHHERGEAAQLARVGATWLADHGHRAWLLQADADAVGLPELGVPGEEAATADLAVSLGGDGTVLRTVELVSTKGVPVIGVNVGLLGYLTEVEPVHLTSALERFFCGDFDVEERMMLSAVIASASADVAGRSFRALNELVVEKRASGHTVRLLVSIAGSVFTSYAADGLIVATPTGSTAYSLSARGPIVSPTHRALLLTPVSPHMLFDRSLVLNPDEEIGIEVIGGRDAEVSIDGRHAAVLTEGDVVTCRSATEVARFVRFGERHFHRILKAKFGLTDR